MRIAWIKQPPGRTMLLLHGSDQRIRSPIKRNFDWPIITFHLDQHPETFSKRRH